MTPNQHQIERTTLRTKSERVREILSWIVLIVLSPILIPISLLGLWFAVLSSWGNAGVIIGGISGMIVYALMDALITDPILAIVSTGITIAASLFVAYRL